MVFLLEDNSIKAGAEDLNGGLIKLLGKNICVQVVFIFNKSRPPLQSSGDDDLRSFEENEIPILHVVAIAFEDMEILGGISA